MFTKDIELLLQKSLSVLPVMVSGRSLRYDVDELVATLLPPSRIAVVDDTNTSQAYGNHVFSALKSRFSATHITLESAISADDNACAEVAARSSGMDALVAVGSGTISDICKYVSFKAGIPYIVFPTAASMNGYLSANASIAENGYKHTLGAHMPKAVFCDLSVIAAAPARLNISGLADSLARPTAQFDWLLSHLLMGTAYLPEVFSLLETFEPQVFDSARGIAGGDIAAIETLIQLLLLSGAGMTMAGGSYPASQSEHMIAHLYSMADATSAHGTLHGEEIAVTALAMAHRQRQLLQRRPALAEMNFPMDTMSARLGSHSAKEAKAAYYTKLERIETASLNTDTLAQRWDDAAGQLEKTMIKPERLEAIAKEANAPVHHASLKWNDESYAFARSHARFMRDRFTCLDIES